MEELFPGVFKIMPSKLSPHKYISFFIERQAGNLLFPCYSSSSTIDASFAEIEQRGGLAYQLLGDSHFKSAYCDTVAERFNAPLYVSEKEAPDVAPKLAHVQIFPFTPHQLAPDIEVIPTPGHRPGGVCYLVTMQQQTVLWAGDFIWHNGDEWGAFPTKAGRQQIVESLQTVAEKEWQVLLANTKVSNPTCFVEVAPQTRAAFIESIIAKL